MQIVVPFTSAEEPWCDVWLTTAADTSSTFGPLLLNREYPANATTPLITGLVNLGATAGVQKVNLLGLFPGVPSDYEDAADVKWSAYCHDSQASSSANAPVATQVTYANAQMLTISCPSTASGSQTCIIKAVSRASGSANDIVSNTVGPLVVTQ